MAKIVFYPLDITYKIREGKAHILLFGRSSNGDKLCVVDSSFRPYFYVTVPENKIDSSIDMLYGLKIEDWKIVSVDKQIKRLKEKEKVFLKITSDLPGSIPKIKKFLIDSGMIDNAYEYDILFTRRYMIDKEFTFLRPLRVEGEISTDFNLRVPIIEASSMEILEGEPLSNLKKLAIDIETYHSGDKSIVPERYPILMISLYGEYNGSILKKVITWKEFETKNDYVEFVESEEEMIREFRKIFLKYNPDILTGYYTDGFDLPYIVTRAKKYNAALDLGIDRSEIVIRGNENKKCSITGIPHIDILKFIRVSFGGSLQTDTYTLNAVASEILGDSKLDISLDSLSEVWDNRPEDLDEFCEYNLYDSFLTFKLCEQIFPNIKELSMLTGMALFDTCRLGLSQLVENFILKKAVKYNEAAPNKPSYDESSFRRENRYQGAFVFEPKPGYYKDIVVFDFRSLYPSIITSHNISIGTLNCSCCKREGTAIEGSNAWFCKKKRGFMSDILSEIISLRKDIKEKLKEDRDNIVLKARSDGLKLLANSFYGYLGFFGARWYCYECANAITALGRYYIKRVIEIAGKMGFEVLYSDTDSIFLSLGYKTKEDAYLFAKRVNSELPGVMELEYEDLYTRGIFVATKGRDAGAKKKYALLSENGFIKLRGFEAVRRNWSIIAKEVQENVIEMILREDAPKLAFDYVKEVIDGLRKKEVDTEKLVIFMKLRKELGQYDAVGPHVVIARRLRSRGIEVGKGSMIRYVITEGPGIIRDRAKLPEDVEQGEYDAEYYINNQVIPAVENILKLFGYSKDLLMEKKDQSKLGSFF